jgi:uncharacterized OB-fold protein
MIPFTCEMCGKSGHSSFPVAARCDSCTKPGIRGLGDVVAATARKLGFKSCGGCKKRQKTLNKWVPFK